MSILDTAEYDQNEELSTYHLNCKVLTMAIILLSMVVLFIILIQIYARWFLRRHLNIISLRSLSDDGVNEGALSQGLDSKTIASLPKFVYEKKLDASLSSSECVVCLSGIEEGETIRVMKRCKHMFHVECIDMWLFSHSTCPICRAAVEDAMEDSVEPQMVISAADQDQEIETAVVKEEMENSSVVIVINDVPETSVSSASSSLPSSTCSCSLKLFASSVFASVQVD